MRPNFDVFQGDSQCAPLEVRRRLARKTAMKILVSGAAGFIGFHTAKALLDRGDEVVGLDNLNSYYEVTLKEARLSQLLARRGFAFVKAESAGYAPPSINCSPSTSHIG